MVKLIWTNIYYGKGNLNKHLLWLKSFEQTVAMVNLMWTGGSMVTVVYLFTHRSSRFATDWPGGEDTGKADWEPTKHDKHQP